MANQAEQMKKQMTAQSNSNKPKTIFDQLEALRPQIQRVATQHLGGDKMVRLVTTEIRKTPRLGNCSQASLFGAVLDCAAMGLAPGPFGHVYLIPYGQECTLVIGYKGYIDLVRRSGLVDDLYAYPVFEGDEFEVSFGLNPDIIHKPASGAELKAMKVAGKLKDEKVRQLTHVYAVARLKGQSRPHIEVMDREQVDAIRDRSKAGKSGPWVTDYNEMARKTVIKRICKQLPLSAEVSSHINRDERVTHLTEAGELVDVGSIYEVPDEFAPKQVETVKEKKKPVNKPQQKKAEQPKEPVDETVDKETGEITGGDLFDE